MATNWTLAAAFARLDVAVHCSSHLCWRSGGTLDRRAFLARFGDDFPLDALVARLRCRACGAPGCVSLINAVGKIGERLSPPAGARIQPPSPPRAGER